MGKQIFLIVILVWVQAGVFIFPRRTSQFVSAREQHVEDREHWYSQAKDQMEDLMSSRRDSLKGFAKNVILFVGDGMGLSTVTASRILKGQKLGLRGEEYRLSFEKFPFIALAKTYNIDAQTGDSSACATALMCGVKANVNTLGLDHRGKFEDCRSSHKSKVSSIIEWAQKHGKSTGIVTNTRLTHGTPSALYAKTPSRYWEDDAKMPMRSHSSCIDIARQLVEKTPGRNINVLLGGGRRHWMPVSEYDREERDQRGRRTDGRNLIDDWVHDKKTRNLNAEYVWNKSQFDNVDPRYSDYLLGLFGYSHLDFEVDRNKGPDGDPSLAEMTSKAIQILQKKEQGFFLMIEGGRIDHAHHHNNARRALEEVGALDEAVNMALNSTDIKDTLIVLTADHSHVFTIGGDNTPRGHPLTGLDVEVSDVDGKPYTVLLYSNGPGYAHSAPTGRQDLTGFNTQDINFVQQASVPRKYETHSGEDVPVYAIGPGSYLFTGTIEQSYIPHAIAYASCIGDDTSHCQKSPLHDICKFVQEEYPSPEYGPPSSGYKNIPIHDPVVVHIANHDTDSIGKIHNPLTAYEPFIFHESNKDYIDPYPAHAPFSVHEMEDPNQDTIVIDDPIEIHNTVSVYDDEEDSLSANNPIPVQKPAAVYDPNSLSGTYSYSDSLSGSSSYSGGNPYEAPRPFSPSDTNYDQYSNPNSFPIQEKNYYDQSSESIHNSYSVRQPINGQDTFPAEALNPAIAANPRPDFSPYKPTISTTPQATDARSRSRTSWMSNAAFHPFLKDELMFLVVSFLMTLIFE